ncbi:MAG: hypothetical protein JWN04_112 [Myxococcaceae bacterium]|nr:hypothetical protein [Myxococcaceae bacterium]
MTQVSGRTAGDDRSGIAYLQRLSVGDATWVLPAPLKIEIESTEENTIAVFAPLLGVFGNGLDHEAAISDLADTALRIWLEFDGEPDESLHVSARELRRLLAPIFARGR